MCKVRVLKGCMQKCVNIDKPEAKSKSKVQAPKGKEEFGLWASSTSHPDPRCKI